MSIDDLNFDKYLHFNFEPLKLTKFQIKFAEQTK